MKNCLHFIVLMLPLVLSNCGKQIITTFSTLENQLLEKEIKTYVEGKDAKIGVAIIHGHDTVSINGKEDFPMLSVYKFPQALAVADYCNKTGLKLTDSITIAPSDIKPDTWSPMREKYGQKPTFITLSELLDYSLQFSDNNACDILFKLIGGPQTVDSIMKSQGFPNINILNTEEEMHADISLCYANSSTPLEMALLFDSFHRIISYNNNSITRAIWNIMKNCSTGTDRLVAPLLHEGISIAHKTGTGDRNSSGRFIAINDAGYVSFGDGTGYAIAVLISDSGYDMKTTEKFIADISNIAFKTISKEIQLSNRPSKKRKLKMKFYRCS